MTKFLHVLSIPERTIAVAVLPVGPSQIRAGSLMLYYKVGYWRIPLNKIWIWIFIEGDTY